MLLFHQSSGSSRQLSEALLQGLAEDRGLYMPEKIPVFTPEEIYAFKELEYAEIAFRVANKFLADDIPAAELGRLINEAYDYSIPLDYVTNRRYIMRLDQGPTASFKDFAARLMGRLMQHYLALGHRNLLILTATSGDTGSAIANAFYGLDNIQVVVLYPEEEVTARQRKQMTTLGKNIRVIALDGKFDDCQALVKQAFSDPELTYLNLSSANSINIGRLLPQTMYYFYAYARLFETPGEEIVFSVPSGNFGDLMGGLIAKFMGLPVYKFVVATNANDEFPHYVHTGEYKVISPSINCISSAMNVGHPSNVARLIALYGGVMDEKGVITTEPDRNKLRDDIYAVSISDAETEATIKKAKEWYDVLLEPHGAVGWAGLEHYMEHYPEELNRLCVSLETAHPAKFPEKIREILDLDPALPPSLQGLEGKEEFTTLLDNSYPVFSQFLKDNYK